MLPDFLNIQSPTVQTVNAQTPNLCSIMTTTIGFTLCKLYKFFYSSFVLITYENRIIQFWSIIFLILPVDRKAGECLVNGSTCAPLLTFVPLRDLLQETIGVEVRSAAAAPLCSFAGSWGGSWRRTEVEALHTSIQVWRGKLQRFGQQAGSHGIITKF